MNLKIDVYLKKLTTQELGYRKGRLMTGGYFYISKSAIGVIFKQLSKNKLNDFLKLEFNDPLEPGNIIHASFVYHNDKFCKANGTRDEYRIYHNREIAKHELHFQPFEIVAFTKLEDNNYKLDHFRPTDDEYKILDNTIINSKVKGNHALLNKSDYNDLLLNL